MKPTRRALTKRLLLACALSVIAAAILVVRQFGLLDGRVIFFPIKEFAHTPSDMGLYYHDVWLTAADGAKLHGWYVPGTGDYTLLWFHGNAGNISHRVDNMLLFNRRLGVNTLIIDYRGYGRSEGKPSERGMYLDAEAALEYLRDRYHVKDDKLIFFGRSLGCAVAAEMAIRHKARGVILESPLTSIEAIAKAARPKLFSFLPLHHMVMWMLKSRFDSLSKMGDIEIPLLILHGRQDEIIAIEMAKELFAAANEPKSFYIIENAGHNNTYLTGGEAYFEALREFIEGDRAED